VTDTEEKKGEVTPYTRGEGAADAFSLKWVRWRVRTKGTSAKLVKGLEGRRVQSLEKKKRRRRETPEAVKERDRKF